MSEAPAAGRRGELLWEPSAATVGRSKMTRYMRWLEAERGLDFDGPEGWMPLFVVLAEGAELTAEIRRRIRERCSPRHVPDQVYAVSEVPRTLSGKVLEVPVKRILTGTPADQAASKDSLANPAALDPFGELSHPNSPPRRRIGRHGGRGCIGR